MPKKTPQITRELWMQNPFTLPALYRDADVEGMTDGCVPTV